MTNIVPNIMAQTNMSLLDTNYKAFQPIASALFSYDGPPTAQTDEQIKNARTLLQNIINILPSLMQAINDTPLAGMVGSPKWVLHPGSISPCKPFTNSQDIESLQYIGGNNA